MTGRQVPASRRGATVFAPRGKPFLFPSWAKGTHLPPCCFHSQPMSVMEQPSSAAEGSRSCHCRVGEEPGAAGAAPTGWQVLHLQWCSQRLALPGETSRAHDFGPMDLVVGRGWCREEMTAWLTAQEGFFHAWTDKQQDTAAVLSSQNHFLMSVKAGGLLSRKGL